MIDYKKNLDSNASGVDGAGDGCKAGAGRAKQTGIVAELEQEHGELVALIEQVKQGTTRTRRELFEDVRARLLAHSRAEEAVLYDHLARYPEFSAQIRAQRREHSDISLLLARLLGQRIDSDAWLETFVAVEELFRGHVEREEALFSAVSAFYTRAQLEDFERVYIRHRDLALEELERLGPVLRTGS